jgi:hypothetical protein
MVFSTDSLTKLRLANGGRLLSNAGNKLAPSTLVLLAAKTPIPANALVFINILRSDMVYLFNRIKFDFRSAKISNFVPKKGKMKKYLSDCNPPKKWLSL